ncbi:MAG: NADH:ubiquinone reductase (Na(+)-transporting) subunit B [Abyssibacter sp.]|uniref:NADH:ubiquinone reductase (Na(+)-transporting) subunit B n=1 Tax=Abyssibacter sp. TaxID=2320200 RepID=UPI002ECA1485|nr:NADH:ubiquinone reductase (Na(+)-transporting) subunit B [Pseudomonadota bacterium]
MREFLDKMHPLFAKGGKFEKYYAVYEMVDTFFYSPGDLTRGAPHVKDGIDLKRVMIYVWLAVLPCAAFGAWNIGYQANTAMANLGVETIPGWRGTLIHLFAGTDPTSLWDNFWHGLWYFLPIYIVTFVSGGVCEVIFAAVRNHEVNEGFFVTSILYSLILPATTPLWMVSLGIIFGVVIGKEVFGGTGKNFLNPALTGRAFLYFAYPAALSGDAVWTAVDGFSGATPLGLAATGGLEALAANGITWMDAFIGTVQGSVGSTSALLCIVGGGFLMLTGVANWRIPAGVAVGMVLTSWLFNAIGGDNPMMAVTPAWHFVLGGMAFGMFFMATDPVSASHTNTGRWIFGALVGFMTVLIRVVNPAFPEGIMLAILFANIFAPLIDYGVMQANIRRRLRRTAVADAA